LLDKYHGVYLGDTSKKVVYLTFDEGYENGYTPLILDTLKENNVKALFFVTGAYVKSEGNLVKRMLEEGHLVGNHTINHRSLPSLSSAALENELYGLEKRFTALTGKGFKYMRPPEGEYSEKVLAAANQLGYVTVFWSYAYKDYDINDQKGSEHAYKMVMDNLHNGAVILLHAVSSDNANALDRIIRGIEAEGYSILPFDL
jgi:peptidoglycan-N-acetylmuramic acid deacetylase